MPLPAALLAKLKKRGIIKEESPSTSSHSKEEVFAEDYDDATEDKKRKSISSDDGITERVTQTVPFTPTPVDPVKGCPNKINPYHVCTNFCQVTWKSGVDKPSPRTERKYKKLLKRFPLPEGWIDVWEPGSNRYYFWNTTNDHVSWMPPQHSKARVGPSVDEMRKLLVKDEDEDSSAEDDSSNSDSDNELSGVTIPGEDRRKSSDRRHEKSGFRGRHRGASSRMPKKRNDFDPMDPSSYSDDCPRGGWSQGLKGHEDAGGERCADSTASGVLFQQRPLPSPGDILRMNKEKK